MRYAVASYILPRKDRRNVSDFQKFVLHLTTSMGWSACNCTGCEQGAAPMTARSLQNGLSHAGVLRCEATCSSLDFLLDDPGTLCRCMGCSSAC